MDRETRLRALVALADVVLAIPAVEAAVKDGWSGLRLRARLALGLGELTDG